MLPFLTRLVLLIIALLLNDPPESRAQSAELVSLRSMPPQSLADGGFILPKEGSVQITAVGAELPQQNAWKWWEDKSYWAGNAWIVDANTRELVWELRSASTSHRGEGLREFEGSLQLPAGTYEAYYASYPATNWNVSSFDDRSKIHPKGEYVQVTDRDGRRYVTVYGGPLLDRGVHKEFELTVRGTGRPADEAVLKEARERLRSRAFITFSDVEPSGYQHQGFELRRPASFEIYAVGEAREKSAFDYGWIINADTRERVWSMHFDNSSHAGGAEKNRVVRTTIDLPAGRYAAIYSADDSHHPGEWNSVPPHDPDFWGMTITPTPKTTTSDIELFSYEITPRAKPIVDLTRVVDDETRSQGFALTEPLDVRIFTIGEGREGKMYDFGWILDARTRSVLWEMAYAATDHAGGASKNRLADQIIRLGAGEYVAYYATDDSHAYDDWNASPPITEAYWGLTIVPASEPIPSGTVRLFEERRDATALAEVIRVRDSAHGRDRFTLDQDADVRIYAVGEGDDGRMYDYGWIEDAQSGQTVWEMTYRMTKHAGGARKNRTVDTMIRLRPGEYVVHFKTDGSHSFNDWNSERPSDPRAWGITLHRPTP